MPPVVVELGLMVTVLGLPDGALGVVWPSLRYTFGRPVGDLGILAAAPLVPYLVSSTTVARLLRRVSFAAVTTAVATLACALLALWAAAPVWAVAVGALSAYGLARGTVDSAFNAYVAEHEGVRRLGLLHAGYGVGATLSPLLVAAVLSLGGGWRLALALLAGANLVVAVSSTGVRWKESRPVSADAPPPRGDHRAVFAALLVTFTVYVAAEAGVGSWAFVVSTDSRHLARGLSAAAVAAYWAMLTGGRFLLAAIGSRISREATLTAGSLLAAAGVTWWWLDHSPTGLVGIAIAGFGFAATFPIAISLIPDYVGDTRAPSVIGWCVAFAAVGGPLGTGAGALAANARVSLVPVVFVALTVALTSIVTVLPRIAAPD